MPYNRDGRRKYMLQCHLIFVVKYINFKKDLKREFWKENTFWSDGYFVCSIGEANNDTIRKYIENQG